MEAAAESARSRVRAARHQSAPQQRRVRLVRPSSSRRRRGSRHARGAPTRPCHASRRPAAARSALQDETRRSGRSEAAEAAARLADASPRRQRRTPAGCPVPRLCAAPPLAPGSSRHGGRCGRGRGRELEPWLRCACAEEARTAAAVHSARRGCAHAAQTARSRAQRWEQARSSLVADRHQLARFPDFSGTILFLLCRQSLGEG